MVSVSHRSNNSQAHSMTFRVQKSLRSHTLKRLEESLELVRRDHRSSNFDGESGASDLHSRRNVNLSSRDV